MSRQIFKRNKWKKKTDDRNWTWNDPQQIAIFFFFFLSFFGRPITITRKCSGFSMCVDGRGNIIKIEKKNFFLYFFFKSSECTTGHDLVVEIKTHTPDTHTPRHTWHKVPTFLSCGENWCPAISWSNWIQQPQQQKTHKKKKQISIFYFTGRVNATRRPANNWTTNLTATRHTRTKKKILLFWVRDQIVAV